MLDEVIRRSTLVALLTLAAALPSLAQEEGDSLVTAALVSDVSAVSPAHEITLAVSLAISPGWHIYWKNPGDVGMPTVVTLALPEGVEAGELRWPAPTRFVHEGSVSYGYEGTVMLLVGLRASPDLRAEEVTIKARVEWLVCDPTGCLPGGADVEVPLRVSTGAATPSPTTDGAAISKARLLLPGAAPPDLRVRWPNREDRHALVLTVPDASALTFFPHLPDEAPPVDMAARGRVEGERLEVRYPARVAGLPVTGVLAVTRGEVTTYHEVATTAPR